ncbi:ATP-binding protein [Alkalimonas collagenimarina]|uniref:histidine kinase n=1 Tax=Alkalimonas collagenimarina TaxID=400390 RepID=A0ABT9GX03_9GAMM|nr:ATP-binding protein [Alkalimonas collagenimarina]MDP4535596.1 ATP-binding protein [Alkalimonas collagenimarina]
MKLLSYWQVALLLGCILLSTLLTEQLVRQDIAYARGQQLEQQVANAGHIRSFLETELNRALHLNFGLSAYIQAKSGDVTAEEFDLLLPELVKQGLYIRNIGIAPGNVLSYVHPIEGNEGAIGLYYPDIPEQWPAVKAIIDNRQGRLVGPVQLMQGGVGFIHRVPVFIQDDYWGIVSIVVDPNTLWQELQLIADRYGIDAALRTKLDDGQFSAGFFGPTWLFYDDSLLLTLSIRGAEWQLAIRSTDPLRTRALEIRVMGYSVSLLLLALLGWLTFSRRQLQNSTHQLKLQQQYLTTVMDNVADAIVTTDASGHIEQINQAASDIFGLDMSQLQGVHWCSLLYDPTEQDALLAATTSAHKAVITQGRDHFDQAFPLSISRSEVDFNQLKKHVILLRDMTEQHKVDRLKSEFVSTVSHELRTPLTSINGSIGLVLGGVLGAVTPQVKQLLQTAYNNCAALTRLINDLLDIEKLEAGKVSFEFQQVRLDDVLQSAIAANQPLAQSAQISLKLVCLAQNVRVYIDPARLQQVLTNLISNAIKFAPKESEVVLQLSVDQSQARVEVLDDGIGVPEHFQNQLFQKFAQADSSDRKQQQGTGLGLAICRALVEQMDGEIGYQKRHPIGSCFFFAFPRVEPLESTEYNHST